MLNILDYGAIYYTILSRQKFMQGFPEILHGVPVNPHISRYTPPFEEFEVDHCSLPSGESVELSAIPGPSLFVVMAGQGSLPTGSATGDMAIREGHVIFVPANSEIKISADAAGELQLYRAGVNTKFFE